MLSGERRSLAELREHAYLDRGGAAAQSRFWILLCLAAVIATAGVVTDTTPAVIGAMIIAPLGTPILATAFAITEGAVGRAVRSLWLTTAGVGAVVGIGALIAALVPVTAPLFENPQVVGRTSPGLVDLLIALATGVAGALGTARRDIGDVLPGVAISISLVPPLAVVGVAAEDGQRSLAFGALLLFATNLVALVAAGSLVFSALGYAHEAHALPASATTQQRQRAHLVVAVSVLVVALPLAADTVYEVALNRQLDRVTAAAREWAATSPGVRFEGVTREGSTYVVAIEGPSSSGAPAGLLQRLRGALPAGTAVVVDHLYGKRSQPERVP